MARTQVFRLVRRVLGAHMAASGLRVPQVKALTRRQALKLAGAAAGLAALGSVTRALSPIPAQARKAAESSVAIVGGGVAGLTAAYRLSQKGIRPVIFEASNRWGGRMFTRTGFYEGMFCELGGELVDTNHEDLSALADELGLELEPLATASASGGDLYYFGGLIYTPSDMLEPGSGGAFAVIAEQIAADAERLLDESENWTEHARTLDATSLQDYLDQFRGKTADWAIELLNVAYLCEFGVPAPEQSALNLVDFIGTDLDQDFQIFGDSDEAFRIKGGSSALTNALVTALGEKAEMRLNAPLTRIGQMGDKVALTAGRPGASAEQAYDIVILALPFTMLREVEGLDSLGLEETKLAAIRTLGYGNNAKLMCGTTSRPWLSDGAGLPTPLGGSVYADLPFQSLWETSRAQPGKGGILTNYLAGPSAEVKEEEALQSLKAGLAAFCKPMAEAVDGRAVTAFFWSRHPFTRGSYAGARTGQYTTILEAAATPELGGRLQFAGEHTSSDFLGYMNGGVESGNRAAIATAEHLELEAEPTKMPR
jgi:monoamine oxidase